MCRAVATCTSARLLSIRGAMFNAAAIGLIVLAASLFGIFTRPVGLLAALWPANALLLGLMVRNPKFATPAGWLAAVAGYIGADLFAGGSLQKTLLLTSANLAAVFTGYLLFLHFARDHIRLQRPQSVLYLILIVSLAAGAAGLVGAVANPILFHGTSVDGLRFWFVTELANFIAILPVVLAAPAPPWRMTDRRQNPAPRFEWRRSVPILVLALSCGAALFIGGPGAIVYPMPALLWCALTYNLFATALLTSLFSAWLLLSVSMGYLSLWIETDSLRALLSIRMSVALMALAPIAVASTMTARNELLSRIRRMADHDPLTDALNRRAFMEQSGALLQETPPAGVRPVAVLMLDIDNFKKINDTHGHAAGDLVLATFVKLVKQCIRNSDVIGRLGGEEFTVLLTGCSRNTAETVATQIRATFAETTFDLSDGSKISATVSIGLVFAERGPYSVDTLLLAADKALYRAKKAGRNRIEKIDA